jgi:hypothetical protein
MRKNGIIKFKFTPKNAKLLCVYLVLFALVIATAISINKAYSAYIANSAAQLETQVAKPILEIANNTVTYSKVNKNAVEILFSVRNKNSSNVINEVTLSYNLTFSTQNSSPYAYKLYKVTGGGRVEVTLSSNKMAANATMIHGTEQVDNYVLAVSMDDYTRQGVADSLKIEVIGEQVI